MKHDWQIALNIPEGATILRGPDVSVDYTVVFRKTQRPAQIDRNLQYSVGRHHSQDTDLPDQSKRRNAFNELRCCKEPSVPLSGIAQFDNVGMSSPCDACPMRLTGNHRFRNPKKYLEVSSPLSFTRQKQSMSVRRLSAPKITRRALRPLIGTNAG